MLPSSRKALAPIPLLLGSALVPVGQAILEEQVLQGAPIYFDIRQDTEILVPSNVGQISSDSL